MDHVKVQEALGVCDVMIRKFLSQYSASLLDVEQKAKLNHCLDMIVQMCDWPAERLGKSFRWLGYIQGMMHGFDVADLDELKNMSRPTEADEAREAFAKAEAQTHAQKLADQLESAIQYVNHPNAQTDEGLLRQCVAALRGELPEPHEGNREDPLPRLKGELQRRLDDGSLADVSAKELNELAELAASIEDIENDRLKMKAGLAEMRDAADKILPAILPGIIRWANGTVDLRANVMAFHREVVGGECPDRPCVPEEGVARRRIRLIKEEFFEVLKAAFGADSAELLEAEHLVELIVSHATLNVDLVEFADGLADLEYVCEGAFLGFGIDSRPVHIEVQRSNMAKKGGGKREDGKSLKPEGWTPPDIKSIIEMQKATTMADIPPRFRPGARS